MLQCRKTDYKVQQVLLALLSRWDCSRCFYLKSRLPDGTNAAQWLCPLQYDWTTIVAQLDDLCYSSAMVEFAHWLATSWHIWTFLVGGFDIQQVVCCSISNSNKCFSTNVVQQMSQIGWQISKLTLWWLLGRTAGSGNHPQQSLISSSRPSNWNLTLTIPSQTTIQSNHHPCKRRKGSRIFDPCLEL